MHRDAPHRGFGSGENDRGDASMVPGGGAFRVESLDPVSLRADSADPAGAERSRLRMACASVRGFQEATSAARDPSAPAPARLSLLGPDATFSAWLRSWAEDVERVRRTLRIERGFDERAVTIVATIASFGYGVETSLCVESIVDSSASSGEDDGLDFAMLRSGVHPRALVEALLAVEEARRSD